MYDQRQLDEWWSMHYSVVYGGMYLVAGDSIYQGNQSCHSSRNAASFLPFLVYVPLCVRCHSEEWGVVGVCVRGSRL